jgi:four helix bundle protein
MMDGSTGMDEGECQSGASSVHRRVQLEQRMEDFTVRVGNLVHALPRSVRAKVFGEQLLRAAGSVGANYRESRHASSKRQFVSILEIAQREAAETKYWLRVIAKSELLKPERLEPLTQEADELISILTRVILTCKRRLRT